MNCNLQELLSTSISWSLIKFIFSESVTLSKHLTVWNFLYLLPSIFQVFFFFFFFNKSAVHIRSPKYWSFSSSPSNEYSGLISFRTDWLDLLADSQESSPAPQFKGINSSGISLHYGTTLTPIHDNCKNHSFDYMNLCQQIVASAF